MSKFLIGLLAGVVVTFLTLFVVFFAMVRLRSQPTAVADRSVLVMHLHGDIPERPEVEIPFVTGRAHPTVSNVWMALRKAAADPHIKAIVLQPESLAIGWAKLEEIRSGIERFRKSGKPVFAYLRTPGTREYYLASAADRIYLGPEDPLYLKGLRVEMMYFKKTLDKIGVSIEVEHAGKYKDFGDMFTRSDMSPETRQVMDSLLDDLYANLVGRIAAGRKKSPDEVRAIIDQGPFLARQALEKGLVDELRFEDQVYGELKTRLGFDFKKVGLERYVKVPPEAVGLGGKSRIALVIAEGSIIRGSVDDDGVGDTEITSYGFRKLLQRAVNDSDIRGIVVRIDSPGGEVTASDEIWREMNLASRKKPMVVSMSDAAASGGYYMAMTGDPILAYPGTLTGSIGVVFGKPNLHGLYDKLGITKDMLKRGRFADIDSDYKPLDPAERAKLRDGIDASYREFVSKVAEARKKKFEEIEPLAQGRVWLGSQARSRGLVDELGGLDEAIAAVKRKAGIPAAENVTVLVYPPRRSFLDLLLRRSQQEDAVQARIRSLLPGRSVGAWLRGGFLRLMPFCVEVR
jgi:protease IV